jgi:hypothetical protein
MEVWRHAFRNGFAVVLPIKGLIGLLQALEKNDSRLITGSTCFPPPLQCYQNDFVEQCCPVAWAAAWGAPTCYPVSELEMLFAQACWDASALLGDPSASRHLLNWIDATDRAEIRRELIPELRLAINNRAAERPAA